MRDFLEKFMWASILVLFMAMLLFLLHNASENYHEERMKVIELCKTNGCSLDGFSL